MRYLLLLSAVLACGPPAIVSAQTTVSEQPNILWVITDDHRADSIRAFNQATAGRDNSELGFVASHSADELARRGVLFTKAYCNSPGCAPSRTSMHFGMYPHHSGQYGFESGHQSADFCKPMFPKLMADQGYRTAQFGKSGFASFDWGMNKLKKTSPYQVSVDQKELYANERVDWFHRKTWGKGGSTGDEAFWAMPDGGIYIQTPKDGPRSDEDVAKKTRVEQELDLLYPIGQSGGLVIGGVSPQPTATTQDGNIAAAFVDYLQHAGETYQTPWGRKLEGAPTDKPVFVNLGFHFPHTPVLPSKEFRDQFAGKTYQIPEFNKDELRKLPPQLVEWFKKTNFADLEYEAKQQAIRDYYAFCAMGDSLVGEAIEQFKTFSEKQNREYVILYVIGDHGWHLGEQGGESKFAPYDTSNHCAVIAVSSDAKRYPAGTVCDAPIEFVDFAPTFLNLAGADLSTKSFAHLDGRTIDATLSGNFQRDYVIGEMNHHIGPRAYLRCTDFAFSMRVREKNGKPGEQWGHPPGEGVRWALDAPRDDVELSLFDLRSDSDERDNVANDPMYVKLADWFRSKLGRIILGDGRVESDWSKENSYSISNFATGAHDHKLDIPAEIIPAIDSESQQHASAVKHLYVAKLLLRRLASVDLTEEQMAAFNNQSRDLRTRIDKMREEVGITPEVIKARDEVYKELKKSDLTGDEFWNTLQEKAKLTTAQRDVFRETQTAYGKFKSDVLKTLTDEQRANIPKGKMNPPEDTIPKEKTDERDTTSHLFPPGKTVSMTASGKHSVTYHVSVPDGDETDVALRPLLIVFSPGGNGMGLLDKLRGTANSAGWVLVGCDKLRNGMDGNAIEVEMEDEVIEHIFKNVPHDPKRVYLGGFSGGGMRAYGITARRSEPYAGILAYGGWLGGPDYQDEPYRENMSIAMVTGTRDLGASGWVPIDTKTLKKRNCTVKHFLFDGGHGVAPAEVTHSAVEWLDKQWKARQSRADGKTDERIALEILYVGTDDARAKDFKTFLSAHFQSVATTEPTKLTLEMANRADILLLDSVVRSLPDGYTKATLMTGSSAALTGERYGSKIDWLCQCLDNEAYAVDTSHPIFKGPLPVVPTLVEKRCSHTGMKIQAWMVEQPQEDPGLVSSRKHFASAQDSEIISGGVNMKGISGVPLVREANRFLWGFVASPRNMTEEGRRVFVNSLAWIHEFDAEVQTEFAGLHKRSTIKSVLDSPYVDGRNLVRWFEQELIDQADADKESIRKHFEGRLGYVHVPTGSGLLQIDEVAEQFGTPIDDPASIAKWIDMLDGEQAKPAFGLLQRYTRQRIRRKTKQWREWYESNKEQLEFSEERGYRFFVRDAKFESKAAKRALRSQGSETELTEVSPILFEHGLATLHHVDGVAYQYGGWKVTLVIRARVKDGWHFYAADEDNGTNIPTKIDIRLPEGMEFIGDWKLPQATRGELSDGATFERVIRVGKKAIDKTEIKGSIQFQACTKERCLRPQISEFSLPIVVMAK